MCIKFQKDLISSFWVTLLTVRHRQTYRHGWKHNLLGGSCNTTIYLNHESQPRHRPTTLFIVIAGAWLTCERLGQAADCRHARPLSGRPPWTGAPTTGRCVRVVPGQPQHLLVDRLRLAELQFIQQSLSSPNPVLQRLLVVRRLHVSRHLALRSQHAPLTGTTSRY